MSNQGNSVSSINKTGINRGLAKHYNNNKIKFYKSYNN